jgi:hypothetical protein
MTWGQNAGDSAGTSFRAEFAEASEVSVAPAKRGIWVRESKKDPKIKAITNGRVKLYDCCFLVIFIFYLGFGDSCKNRNVVGRRMGELV